MKMKKLHQHLESKLPWYKKWHETEHHKAVHYAILALTIVFTVASILSSTPTKAAVMTYYISPSGSDTASGTITAPWKNLSKLETITLNPGDTVYMRGGIYNSTKPASTEIHLDIKNVQGTATSPITIANYPGEVPIFDLYNVGFPTNANPWGVRLYNVQYVDFKGLVIRNLRQAHSGSVGLGISRGFLLSNSSNTTVEQLNVYNIAGTGINIENSNNNLILNNDSHHNGEGYDTGYGAWNTGDGFSVGTGGDTSTGNTFKGNRTYLNSDDGTDSFDWAGSKITYIGNWSFWNGVLPWKGAIDVPADAANTTSTAPTPSMTPGGWASSVQYISATWSGEGFKLGGHNPSLPNIGDPNSLRKFVYNNVAFENTGGGFQENMEAVYAHKMQLVNNIAWGNGNDGFGFGAGRSSNPSIAHIFMNNIAWNNNRGDSGGDFVFDGINGTSTTNGTSVPSISTNYWHTQYQLNFGNLQSTSFQIAASDFQSLDSTGADGPRQADGSLPNLPFLKLSATSKFIDKGTVISNLNGITIPFNGTKPDLGAYETGTVTPGDTVSPSTSLTSPTTGTTVLGTTQQVAANATDNVGVTKVEFYIDGTTTLLNCTPNPDTTSPYLCIWNTTTVSNGTHTITSKAYDAAGNSAISSVVSVNVQNAPSADTTAPVFTPTGALSSPSANLSVPVGTSYDITAHATDNVGMAKVEFYKDGVLINTQTSGPNSDFTYSWNTTGLTVGSTHSWTAKAYDTASPANVSTTTARVITIGAGADTIAPTTSITNPTSGYYRGGTRMTLKATSSDNVGVTKVEFYVNDVLKCTDTTVSYTCSWTMPTSTTVTSYVIKAKAYDAAGNVGTSADVKTTNKKISALTMSADAGTNQIVTLPTNSVTLAGTYITNTLTTTTAWSKVSGSGTITSPTSTTTTVTGLTAGTSVFQFTVNNGAGGIVSATTTITVNPASTGNITFPSSLSLNGSPAGSTITGNVSVELPSVTSTNTITKVEFYEGTNLIGTDNTSAPYTISTGWNTASVANGSHTFTAKAYDNQGNTATTPAVTYTVSN